MSILKVSLTTATSQPIVRATSGYSTKLVSRSVSQPELLWSAREN